MNQREASEVVFGGCLSGVLKPGAVNPEWLVPPFNRAITDLNNGMTDITELMAKYDYQSVAAAQSAAETVDFVSFDWVRHLRDVAVRAQVGDKLERIAKRLKMGENEQHDQILLAAADLDRGHSTFVRMSEVEPLKEAWVPSYYPPIDEIVGGLPIGGLMIIAGPAGLGKTTLALEMMMSAAKEGKQVAFFSLEMVMGAAAMRLLELDARGRAYQKNIYTTDRVMGISDLYAESVRIAAEVPLYAIFVDYCDMLVEKEQSEETMGTIYNGLARLAKNTGIPVVALAGVSRGYIGGRPHVNHIRYSGRAEHAATVILLIYRPGGLDVDMADKRLPHIEGQGYIIVGKSRYKMNRPTIGAIQVEWQESKGRWGDKVIGYIEELSG